MQWYILLIIFIGIFIYFFYKDGNRKFWKYAQKHPYIAYSFFMENDCWYVVHAHEFKAKPKEGKWTGPFYVIVPRIGRIKVYGRDGEYEIKQQEFIKIIDKM